MEFYKLIHISSNTFALELPAVCTSLKKEKMFFNSHFCKNKMELLGFIVDPLASMCQFSYH